MKNQGLVPFSIRLRPDQIVKINQFEINLGEWVRDKFDKDFMSSEEIDKKIAELQEQIETLNGRKALNIKDTKQKDSFSKKEIDFLLKTREILSKDKGYLDGRISKYTNDFGKPFKLSRQDFLELLERVAQTEAERILNNENGGKNENGTQTTRF